MAFQHWQVGLDIQNGQLCALAVQRHRRCGWQLRNWWQHPLPPDTLINGEVQPKPELIARLADWRSRLPRSVSVRVGLHPQLMLQRELTLPEPHSQLREPDRSRYITTAARRFFPIEMSELAFDYRDSPLPGQICLTAARKTALESWLHCLQEAGIVPDIFEQTPSALRALAAALKLKGKVVLIHGAHDHWLWYAPGQPEPMGWCPRCKAQDLTSLLQMHPVSAEHLYISDSLNALDPVQGEALFPLSAFTLLSPPLPQHQQPFTLAAGLAIRPEERSWSG